MEFKFFEVQSMKEDILNTLTSMETVSDDNTTCQNMTSIADNLDKIVSLVKKDKVLNRTPVVINSLKDIKDFSEKLHTIIRGRSWHAICAEFNPIVTMENIKVLKSILTKSLKPEKKEKTPKSNGVNFVDEDDGGSLVDDVDWIKHTNKVANKNLTPTQQANLDKKQLENKLKIEMRDRKLQRAIDLRNRI